MSAPPRLVVVGGDAAGMSAASQARRLRPDIAITVFERGSWVSYSACGMPYHVGKLVDPAERLIIRTIEDFHRHHNIEVFCASEVTDVDTRGARVKARVNGSERWSDYDELLIATGALPVRPPVPGVEVRGIHALSTLATGIAVREALDHEQPRQAVIVGGGYIGIEMAEAFLMRGLEVSLVDQAPQVMGSLDADMAARVGEALERGGVRLYLGESLEGFESEDGHVRAVVTSRRTLKAQLVILGIGVAPNTILAREAGIPVGVKGAIKVDARMHTEVDGVWAAGDCAECYHQVARVPVHLALGTVANKQGRVAGINLGGGQATFPGAVGTAVTRFQDLEVGRTGLTEADLRAAGRTCITSTVTTTVKAPYYPEAGEITTKLVAEPGSGRLLGGQVVGSTGSAKRIDVVATALYAGLTVQDLVELDLGYAPPFSSPWDPVMVAAREAVKQI